MIAWRWKTFIDGEIPHYDHHFYLDETMDQQEGFHIDLPLLHDESYLVYLPKATLNTWEEPLGDGIIAENLKQWRRLLKEEATRRRGRFCITLTVA